MTCTFSKLNIPTLPKIINLTSFVTKNNAMDGIGRGMVSIFFDSVLMKENWSQTWLTSVSVNPFLTPVAHLVVNGAVTLEVVSLRLRPDQHSGSLNN